MSCYDVNVPEFNILYKCLLFLFYKIYYSLTTHCYLNKKLNPATELLRPHIYIHSLMLLLADAM